MIEENVLRRSARRWREDARALGMCDEYYESWGTPDANELMRKFVKGVDFCIEHNWPTAKMLVRNLGNDFIHKFGVWADERVGFGTRWMMVMGKCRGSVTFSGYDVSVIYVKDDSRLNIEVKDFARVSVRVFGRAKVNVVNRSYNQSFVYTHGSACKCVTTGSVKVRDCK